MSVVSVRNPRWILLGLGILAWPGSARASSVTELVREAKEHEAAHEDELAVRRYTEALVLDPTCESAYLGLGDLRYRRGDVREAERVFSVALEHAPQLRTALVGRAHARRALGAREDADADLERYLMTEEDVAELRELAGWYADEGRTAAQLATWRRLLALAMKAATDPPLLREARTMVKALQILMGTADPVVAPPSSGDTVRTGIAAMAKRGA